MLIWPDSLRQTNCLVLQLGNLFALFIGGQHLIQNLSAALQHLLLACQQSGHHLDEARLDGLLLDVWRCAALSLLVFPVAAPYHGAVWVVRVPDLASVEAAAVSAYNPAGEHATSAIPAPKLPAALDLHLYQLKYLGTDDGWVAVPDMILRKLTLVLLHLLREEICAEGLLQNCIPHVFLIRKDALNRRLTPRLSLHGRRDTRSGEGLGDCH